MMSFLVKMVSGATDDDKDQVVDQLKAFAKTVNDASVCVSGVFSLCFVV